MVDFLDMKVCYLIMVVFMLNLLLIWSCLSWGAATVYFSLFTDQISQSFSWEDKHIFSFIIDKVLAVNNKEIFCIDVFFVALVFLCDIKSAYLSSQLSFQIYWRLNILWLSLLTGWLYSYPIKNQIMLIPYCDRLGFFLAFFKSKHLNNYNNNRCTNLIHGQRLTG